MNAKDDALSDTIQKSIRAEEKQFLLSIWVRQLVDLLEQGEELNELAARALRLGQPHVDAPMAARIEVLLAAGGWPTAIERDNDSSKDRVEDPHAEDDLFTEDNDFSDDEPEDELFSDDEDTADQQTSKRSLGRRAEKDPTPGFVPTEGHERTETPRFTPTPGHEQTETPGFTPTPGHEQTETPGFTSSGLNEQRQTPGFSSAGLEDQTETPGFSSSGEDESTETPGFVPIQGNRKESTIGKGTLEEKERTSKVGKRPKEAATEDHSTQSRVGKRPESSSDDQASVSNVSKHPQNDEDSIADRPKDTYDASATDLFGEEDDSSADEIDADDLFSAEDEHPTDEGDIDAEDSSHTDESGIDDRIDEEQGPDSDDLFGEEDAEEETPTPPTESEYAAPDGEPSDAQSPKERADASQRKRNAAALIERKKRAKESFERRKQQRAAERKKQQEQSVEAEEEEPFSLEEQLGQFEHLITLQHLEERLDLKLFPEDRQRIERDLAKKLRDPVVRSLLKQSGEKSLALALIPRIKRALVDGQPFHITGANLLRMYPQFFEDVQQVVLKLRSEEHFLQDVPQPGWAVITSEVLAASRNTSYIQQKQILKQHAQSVQSKDMRVRRRTLIEALFDLLAVRVVTGKNLLLDTADLTESKVGRQNMAVINFGESGIRISDINRQQTHPQLGVCPNW